MTYTPDVSISSAAQSIAYQDIRQDLANFLEEIVVSSATYSRPCLQQSRAQ
jgi:hypothetical protein